MGRKLKRVWLVPACAIAVIGGLVFLSQHLGRKAQGGGPAAGTVSVGSNAVVAVTRQSIAEVLSLPANAVASPLFSVNSAGSQPIVRPANVVTGSHVVTGQTLFTQGGRPIPAPVPGTVVGWLPVSLGSPTVNLPILRIRYDGFGLAASLTPEDGYRILNNPLTARAEITNGPGPFDCTFLTGADVSAIASSTDTSTGPAVSVLCAIPTTVRVFQGVSGRLAVTSGEADNVLVLPTYAVIGRADSGQVYLVDGAGHATAKDVTLGITNGGSVQIVSGLTVGDLVLANPPDAIGPH